MENQQYWLVVFSTDTWQDFTEAGAEVMGFNEHQWFRVQKIKPRDHLLCYVMRLGRFIGALEVKSEPYIDQKRIWKKQVYPYRLRVAPVMTLTFQTAVPVVDIKNKLWKLQSTDRRNPNMWGAHFRTSPSKWLKADYETVINAMEEAKKK